MGNSNLLNKIKLADKNNLILNLLDYYLNYENEFPNFNEKKGYINIIVESNLLLADTIMNNILENKIETNIQNNINAKTSTCSTCISVKIDEVEKVINLLETILDNSDNYDIKEPKIVYGNINNLIGVTCYNPFIIVNKIYSEIENSIISVLSKNINNYYNEYNSCSDKKLFIKTSYLNNKDKFFNEIISKINENIDIFKLVYSEEFLKLYKKEEDKLVNEEHFENHIELNSPLIINNLGEKEENLKKTINKYIDEYGFSEDDLRKKVKGQENLLIVEYLEKEDILNQENGIPANSIITTYTEELDSKTFIEKYLFNILENTGCIDLDKIFEYYIININRVEKSVK